MRIFEIRVKIAPIIMQTWIEPVSFTLKPHPVNKKTAMKNRIAALITTTALCSLLLSSCSNSVPFSLFASATPTPTQTPTPTATPTPTSTPMPTPTAVGGGNGLIYVSYMQNFSTVSSGYGSGIQYDCAYTLFDTTGKQLYEMTECTSGDYSVDVMFPR